VRSKITPYTHYYYYTQRLIEIPVTQIPDRILITLRTFFTIIF
jgi:hypothetical protein